MTTLEENLQAARRYYPIVDRAVEQVIFTRESQQDEANAAKQVRFYMVHLLHVLAGISTNIGPEVETEEEYTDENAQGLPAVPGMFLLYETFEHTPVPGVDDTNRTD